MTAPWQDFPKIWKTEACYWSWLRGNLRRIWNHHPVKVEFMREKRKRIIGARGKEVWGGECSLCKKDFPAKEMQVDHVIDAGSLVSIEDITPFVTKLLMCSKDNLQYVCSPCHKIKTHSERKKISLSVASAEKKAIAILKQTKDVEWLREHNIVPESNAKKRREQIVNFFIEKEDDIDDGDNVEPDDNVESEDSTLSTSEDENNLEE